MSQSDQASRREPQNFAAYDALQVFLRDPLIRAWLDEHDPMAVQQALEASAEFCGPRLGAALRAELNSLRLSHNDFRKRHAGAPRIVIEVEGGLVQAVYSTVEGLAVDVFDRDLEECGEGDWREHIEALAEVLVQDEEAPSVNRSLFPFEVLG